MPKWDIKNIWLNAREIKAPNEDKALEIITQMLLSGEFELELEEAQP